MLWRLPAASKPYLIILLFGVAASILLWLHTGEVALSADIRVHTQWSENFTRQLWSGELYPRWLESINCGLGSPTFFFYPPLPFFVSALWHPLALVTGVPWFAVAAAATVAMVAAGLSAYAWLRSFATPRASLVAAVFYMVTPFHLGADLYARFVFAELWGFVWMPLVLLASRPAHDGDSGPWAIRTSLTVAIPYSLLAISHLPTLLLFSALPVLQSVVLSSPKRRVGHVIAVLFGMVLGFAMAGAFVIPAWRDRAFASIAEIDAGWAQYAYHFLIDASGDVANASINWFERGLDLWILLVLAFTVYAAMFLWKQDRKPGREEWFWILISVGSVFVTTRLAEPVWRYVPLIRIVQFPWRFGTLSTLAVSALAALVLTRAQAHSTSVKGLVSEYVNSWKSAAVLALSLLAFAAMVFEYSSKFFRYPMPWLVASVVSLGFVYCWKYGFGSPLERSDRRPVLGAWLIGGFLVLANVPHVIPHVAWHLDALRGKSHPVDSEDTRALLAASFDPPEYRISTVAAENYNPSHMLTLRNTLPPITMMAGSGTVSMVSESARRNIFDVDAAAPITVLFRRYYYPGTTLMDSTGHLLGKVTPAPGEGLVLAELPAGAYKAQLVLVKGANETLGLWVSCLAIALSAALGFYVRSRPHH